MIFDYRKFADRFWTWRGYKIGYCAEGLEDQGLEKDKPAIVLIHGFGASVGHWRKNVPVLAQKFRVYAIDLIGFGSSAQPKPS